MAPADPPASMPDRILDAALDRAAIIGWDALHLYQLADDIGVSLAEIAHHVPDKHSLGQLLFDRADRSLLDCARTPGWRERPAAERLELSLMAWFQALAPHREQVRQMLRYQLQADHLHLQIQGVLRVSRTVQWWREAGCLAATGFTRELLEAALTAMYLSTVAYWLRDDSADQSGTRRWLARNLMLSSSVGRIPLGV
jgi:AcrR family transcriptional regulator